jgi:aminoglycoside phosphotransferase (APT) family kinase protein
MGDDALRRATAAARRVPGWETLALRLEPVEIGITNRNYKVTLPDGTAWMVRLPGERTEVLGIDRACEAEAARRADTLGIGPPVLGELPGVGTLVTRFVTGAHAPDVASFSARLDALVPLLRAFHRSGRIAGRFPIFRVVEWHERDARANGVGTPAAYVPLHDRALDVERALATARTPEVPCHNDLLPANVLFDATRAWLLDWEYAGMNDPYFDLGNLAVNAGLDEAAERHLLELYAGAVSPSRWARLQLMKIMSEFREGMWAVVQQGISTLTNIDFVAYADEHLDRCGELFGSPSFAGWLADAASPV